MAPKQWIMSVAAVLMAAASAAQAESWKFVVCGDSRGGDNGVNTGVLSEIGNAAISENAKAILFSGDLVSGYTNQATFTSQLTTWRNTLQPVYTAGIKVYGVAGNHETSCTNWQTAWNNVFTGQYAMPTNGPAGENGITYSVPYNNALFVGLDEDGSHPMAVNQTWLNQQFAASDQPHVFAFGHYPAFKANHADCMDDAAGARDTFWNSLKGEGARVYFTGHDHFYDHARLDDGDLNPNNDLHQFIVGGGGASFAYGYSYNGVNDNWTPRNVVHEEGVYGYLVVEINDSLATMTYKHRLSDGTYAPQGDVFSYVVPEPGSSLLLGLGAVGMLLRRRRQA